MLPAVAAAQGTAVFRGSIRSDSGTGSPVANAEVIVGAAATTRTSATGAFLVAGLAPGSYAITVRHPSYKPRTGTIRLDPNDTVTVHLGMEPLAVDLPGARIEAAQPLPNTGIADFEERKKVGVGKFLRSEDYADRPNATLADVLRSHAPELQMVQQPGGGFAAASRRVNSMSPLLPPAGGWRTAFGQLPPEDQCYMQVFVDGQRLYTYHRPEDNGPNPPKLDDYLASTVAAIEIYKSGADTPIQFNTTGGACGTLVIWTGVLKPK